MATGSQLGRYILHASIHMHTVCSNQHVHARVKMAHRGYDAVAELATCVAAAVVHVYVSIVVYGSIVSRGAAGGFMYIQGLPVRVCA